MALEDLTPAELAAQRTAAAQAATTAQSEFNVTRDAALAATRAAAQAVREERAAKEAHTPKLKALQAANLAVARVEAEVERRELSSQISALAEDAPERPALQRQLEANASKRRQLGG